MEVHPHGQIIVRSPMRTPLHELEAFIRSRRGWLSAKLAEAQSARSVIPALPSPLHLHHRGEVIEWTGTPEALARWQRAEARGLFEAQIEAQLPRMGVAALRYQKLVLRKMKRRWGSCASDGKITLNEHLIRLPDVCSEAVVAHELAHLVHMNHGREFHTLARQIMPGYDEANALLDAWTALLVDLVPKTVNGAQGPVEQRIVWLADELG